MFNYSNNRLDYRSVFANKICKLFIDKHNGDIFAAVNDFKELNADIHHFIRNVYELVDCEIPLMGLFDLSSYGPDNWDFTEQDYNDAKVRAIDACREFYKD